MEQALSQYLFILEMAVFAPVIFMHLAKKNTTLVALYVVQSLAVALLLLIPASMHSSSALFITVFLVFAIKVIVAPRFFFGIIKKHKESFAVSAYLNLPLTLIVITLLTAVAHSRYFAPLALLAAPHGSSLLLAVAAMLVSLFMIINRRGALSQMVGILSLENAIVSFASFAGLEQGPSLQIGIMFDIFVWIFIGSVFISMIHGKFGSFDVTAMKNLKE